MSEVVKRLRERRLKVWEEAKALAESAAEENRAFEGQEQEKWQTLNGELDALDSRIKNILDGEKRAKDTEEQFAAIRGTPEPKTPGDQLVEQENSEFRKFLTGNGPRSVEVRIDSSLYRELALVKAGKMSYRDLVKGTATAGGNTVPTSFLRRLVEHLIEVSGVMRAGPTILNTASGENIQVPKTTAHSTASIVGEAATIGEDDPTFGQITLGSFKYGNMVQVTRELVTDTGVDLEGYLARDAGRAIGNALGAHLVNGTGTSQPRGVITDASVGVTGAGAATPVGTFTAENLIDLKFSVIEPYRRSANWLMRDATLAEVRKLRDESGGAGTSTGQFLFQPALVAGEPDMLLGHPIVTDPFVPAVGDGTRSVAFGDISAYFVRTVGSVRFERSDDFAFDTDMVSFRSLYRADAALVDLTGAVKVFVGGGVT